jgi:putative membrane protein
MNRFFWQRWLITTLSVLVASHVVPGIRYESLGGLFLAALALGVLNAIVRPVLVFFTLPLVLFSLGFFLLVINAGVLYLVGQIVPGFHVTGFWPAFWGSLVISVVGFVANRLIGPPRIARPGSRPGSGRVDGPSGSGNGPVIDV